MRNKLIGFSTLQPQTISERITYARELRGLSQGDLARQSGIAATQLSRYETGRAGPRKLAVARLAQALAVSLRWLETGEGRVDEYPSRESEGLGFWIDDELRRRLMNYAEYNGLTATEALADILDAPLSVYGDDDLPPTEEGRQELRKTLGKYRSNRVRTEVVARKIQLLHPPPGAIQPAASPKKYIVVGNIGRDPEARLAHLGMRPVGEVKKTTPNRGPVRSPNARKPKP